MLTLKYNIVIEIYGKHNFQTF